MSVEGADNFLPKSANLADVFQVPLLKHNPQWTTLTDIQKAIFAEDILVHQVASGIFTAGVAYFANRGHSPQLQDMGATMWWQVNQKSAIPMLTNNIAGAAFQLGAPIKYAIKAVDLPGNPIVILNGAVSSPLTKGVSIILLPMDLVLRAKTDPVINLAQIAWVGSQIRDAAYNRMAIDPEKIGPRANAFEAHFLRYVLDIQPETPLSEYYRYVLDHYPEEVFIRLNYKSKPLAPIDLKTN